MEGSVPLPHFTGLENYVSSSMKSQSPIDALKPFRIVTVVPLKMSPTLCIVDNGSEARKCK